MKAIKSQAQEVSQNTEDIKQPVVADKVISADVKKRRRVYSPHGECSMTKQEFTEVCDINKIMKRYERDGVLPVFQERNPVFADVSMFPSYQETLNKINAIQEGFDQLPSNIRYKFDNDPAKLLDFVADPANQAEAVKLGLIKQDEQKVAEKAPEAIKAPLEAQKGPTSTTT